MRHWLLVFLCLIALPAFAQNKTDGLIDAALTQTKEDISYDGRYFKIPYPGGDVPAHLGVCTDVVIRAYRALGTDLQVLVHEDMKKNFATYPKQWGMKTTDTNIDHRRVPNLQVFFKRHGQSLPITQNPDDYKTGDLVTWNLRTKGSLPHIGIVTNQKAGANPMIVHNIGAGPQLEDMLFDYKITGHYRYGL
jgi:uncharacterized protein YijF (DUF1287 family)